jgi:hypothetical protein
MRNRPKEPDEEPILETLAAIDSASPTGREHLRAFRVHDGLEERVVFRRFYLDHSNNIVRGHLYGLRREELRQMLPALTAFCAEGAPAPDTSGFDQGDGVPDKEG